MNIKEHELKQRNKAVRMLGDYIEGKTNKFELPDSPHRSVFDFQIKHKLSCFYDKRERAIRIVNNIDELDFV